MGYKVDAGFGTVAKMKKEKQLNRKIELKAEIIRLRNEVVVIK